MSINNPPVDEVRSIIEDSNVPGVTAPMISRQLDECQECSDDMQRLQEAISTLKEKDEIDGEVTDKGAVVWWLK